MANTQEEDYQARIAFSHRQALICSKSNRSRSYLPAEVDRSQCFRQEASPSHLSDGQRQSRHQVVARLLTRMEWSQSHASSRLGAGFRSSAVHRRILQQSMDIWKVFQPAAGMEGAVRSRSSSSDLGAPMADEEDSSPL